MPRSDRDNQDLRSARRAEILAAATRVFTTKGVARTKVADIAAAAGLSNGLLYHYFPSKEAVFEAIAIEMMQQADADVLGLEGRAIDRLAAAMHRRIAVLGSPTPDASRVVMQAVLEGAELSPELHARLLEHLQRMVERVAALVAEAQADGDIEPTLPAAEVAHVLLYLFRGMSIRIPDFPVPLPAASTVLRLLQPASASREQPTRRVS